ncbi:hypothetical protein H072_11110 [Dactylellina haptotyla CBS 200.50]|uniref:Uncharacterized protein n=1 Tax=Dactylellina haptotyla (strain CBS 200.50) TaxID=1284197 RepID=S7ZXK5_DACHA|nr:hypothetical protein H072_11110 [Dactylellina haptotyla CBS 200.50]
MPRIRSYRENIEIMLGSLSEHPGKQRDIREIIADTLWGWDKLFRAWDKYLAELEEAQMQRDREVASAVALEASEGLRRRKNAANSVYPSLNQDETDLNTNDEPDDRPMDSATPKPIKNSAVVPAIAPWHNISFPPFFYPTARPTAPRLKILLLDRNTLLLLVFFLALISGIFSGMAFFNPNSQIYSSLSQLFRLLASLWCLQFPLLRDKALPIWPARGWLYGAVGVSAGLGVLGVILVTFDISWSGLIAALGDFAALGATMLLAMGINGGSSVGGHSATP